MITLHQYTDKTHWQHVEVVGNGWSVLVECLNQLQNAKCKTKNQADVHAYLVKTGGSGLHANVDVPESVLSLLCLKIVARIADGMISVSQNAEARDVVLLNTRLPLGVITPRVVHRTIRQKFAPPSSIVEIHVKGPFKEIVKTRAGDAVAASTSPLGTAL